MSRNMVNDDETKYICIYIILDVLTSGWRLGLDPIGQIDCVISVEPLRALHNVSKIELVWKALIKLGRFLLLQGKQQRKM